MHCTGKLSVPPRRAAEARRVEWEFSPGCFFICQLLDAKAERHAERSQGILLASLNDYDYCCTPDASAALGMTFFSISAYPSSSSSPGTRGSTSRWFS